MPVNRRGSEARLVNENSGRVRNYPNYLWSQKLVCQYKFSAELGVVGSGRVLNIKAVHIPIKICKNMSGLGRVKWGTVMHCVF